MKDVLNDLPEYLSWANGLALQMVRANQTPELVRIMAHILGCERVWADRILGQTTAAVPWPDWELAECERRIAENAGLYRSIVRGVDAAQDIHFTTMRGDAYTMTAGVLVLQIFTHGAYHRGQMAQDVRRAGGEFVDTDYFLFQLSR